MKNNGVSTMTDYELLFRKAREIEPIIARAKEIIRPIAPYLRKIQEEYQLSECTSKQPPSLPLSSVVVEKELFDSNQRTLLAELKDKQIWCLLERVAAVVTIAGAIYTVVKFLP